MEQVARTLEQVDIEKEMRSSYLDYSMSVIIGRALPDVRDGLKPVHRRILYAMMREGNLSSRRYSKCAGVVGEVLKKYHPHGDSAVYDALVRMAQPWNMRAPLVDGQGNFGSVDGDPAAAYRYTECRMQKLAEYLLLDIDKDTVNFGPNFDGATEEPLVLPAAYPNLIVNGSDGIAVGMATRIPPHNLGEVIDGVVALIRDPALSDAELLRIIPGPDFPTAGTIYGRAGAVEAATTGRGKIILRGNAFFEDMAGGRSAIIIDELPYQVNKARFVEEIADLVKNRRIEGISALRDESDRRGMRVVIELKRDAVRDVVLNHLFKHTALQTTYGVILLAIVNNRPVVLTLREALQHYLSHRRDVTLRRCRFELRKALARQHILDGYLIALDNLDEVINLIRASPSPDVARDGLIERFGLSQVQAQAILDMRLQRLTGMERQKLEEEYAELARQIGELKEILANDARLLQVIEEELLAVKHAFADQRRTRIVDASSELTLHDLIAEEEQVVTLSVRGYIKRTSLQEYQDQKRGGFGKTAMRTRDEDSIQEIFTANTHGQLLVFTTHGQVYRVSVYSIPESGRGAKGTPMVNLVSLEAGDKIAAVVSVRGFEEEVDLLFCSRQGLVKRTPLSEFRNLRTSGLRAYDCADGDELFTVIKAHPERDVLILTRDGLSIRFPGEDVRPMGRVARGVRGIDLQEGDEIAGMLEIAAQEEVMLLTVTENGYGKRTPIEEYRVQSRNGKGILDIKTNERNGRVAGAVPVHEDDRVMLITDTGRVIKMRVANVRAQSRNTMGVTLMRIEDDERIVSVARVVEQEEDVDADAGGEGDADPAPDGAADAGEE